MDASQRMHIPWGKFSQSLLDVCTCMKHIGYTPSVTFVC